MMKTIDECGRASLKLFGQVIPLVPKKDSTPSTSDYQVAASNPPKGTEGFAAGKDYNNEEEAGEAKKGTELMAKKPSKILPCPRCSSTDTKFCYYNNYNVKQPRHFCRDCQRYWTAGGVMRNVPVGAGKRKNKSTNNNKVGTLKDTEVVESSFQAQPCWVHQYWYPILASPAIAESPMGSLPSPLGKHWRHESNPPTMRGSCKWWKQSCCANPAAEAEEEEDDRVGVVLRANPVARERSMAFRECV